MEEGDTRGLTKVNLVPIPQMCIMACNRIKFLYNQLMPPQLTSSEMSYLAWSLCALSDGESEVARTALAWTFRNRLEARREQAAPTSFLDACSCPESSCRSGSEEMSRFNVCDFQSADFCAALSSLRAVWSGTQIDPTEGALSFHRHDQLPRWAKSIEPCALIGSYFFYKGAPGSAFASMMNRHSSDKVTALGSNYPCTLGFDVER